MTQEPAELSLQPHGIISENSSLVRRKKPYVKKSREIPITRNRTSGLVGNKNSHDITQSVMAKNRSISKLTYYNQKQRSNKKPQEAVKTTPKTL